MRLTIQNKQKMDIFVTLIQLLKNWGSYISINYETDGLFIQTMDKSHICLANIKIKDSWFSEYKCTVNQKISVNSSSFAIIINYALKHDILEIKFQEDKEVDNIYINLLNQKENKSSFEHFFEVPLIDVEDDILDIPSVDYEVDFTIETKKFSEVLSELLVFGQDLNILCNDNMLELNAYGETGKLKVNIPIEDLNEYAIEENYELDISYSLNHLSKMCTSIKLTQMVDISLSSQFPMAIKYNLGEDSCAVFYIAPKVKDL